jgi:hypothetical protein
VHACLLAGVGADSTTGLFDGHVALLQQLVTRLSPWHMMNGQADVQHGNLARLFVIHAWNAYHRR